MFEGTLVLKDEATGDRDTIFVRSQVVTVFDTFGALNRLPGSEGLGLWLFISSYGRFAGAPGLDMAMRENGDTIQCSATRFSLRMTVGMPRWRETRDGSGRRVAGRPSLLSRRHA